MKLFTTVVFLLCMNGAIPAQELFNDGWSFHKGDTSETASGNNWRTVVLPHDWSIEGPFGEQWASATAYLPGGTGWYKKEFDMPGKWQSKHVFIYFDGVYKNSTVWLNGHLLGNRPNGFISFQYELTPYLNKNGKNTITVKVDHHQFADSRWYTGSGIYRNVYLVVKDPLYIPTWGVQFTTPTINAAGAKAAVRVKVRNRNNSRHTVAVECRMTDNTGTTVAKQSQAINVSAADSSLASLTLLIPKPKLWSVENPSLYHLSVSLLSDGKIVDSYNEKVGIRSLRFDADSGFFLNNQNIKLKGVCIHDDAGALGVAVPKAVWRSRLQTLKNMGCNSIRMSHNPHADYLYDLCDEMGFLVLDEAFDEWETGKNKWIEGWNVGTPGKDGYHEYFADWANIDVRDMILRNYNHPGIIAWSIGNEIDYPNDPYSSPVLDSGNNPQIYGKGYLPDHPAASRLGELSKQLRDVVKQYDTTRPVTAALAGVVMSNTTSYPGNLDWVGYNYQEYRYGDDHQKYPDRIIYGSENGMQLKAWNAVDSNEYISAQYLWTGIDYLGEAGKWPTRSNGAGLIDLCGFPKPEYYFRQSLWSDKPMIYIGVTKAPAEDDKNIWRHLRAEPSWNWENGDKLRVNCFTNCEEAELFLNGKSLGKKKMSDASNRILSWDVPFAAGSLQVVGYKEGKKQSEYTLQTAGDVKAIRAGMVKGEPDNPGFIQLPIHLVDEKGTLVNAADNDVSISITGDAVLLGMESGSHTSHEDYKSAHRKAKNGRLIAYIQKKKGAGACTVTAHADGVQSSTVSF